MTSGSIAGARVLTEIRRKFSRWRRANSGKQLPVPHALRTLAVSALGHEYTPGQVAEAAGVSRQSVVNWQDIARQTVPPVVAPAPIELKLIDGPVSQADDGCAPGEFRADPIPTARIVLRSGITVALPASYLNAELLLALNGGAP